MAELARQYGMDPCLIEIMDFGNRNGWKMEAVAVTSSEMLERISSHLLYAQHLQALKLQGKRGKTIDGYSRGGAPHRRLLQPLS